VNDATTNLEFAPSLVRINDLQKIGEGRQAELFIFGAGVVKLFRFADSVAAACLEATVMSLVQTTGIPMPRFLGTVTIEGRPGIVMERLAGTDQLSLLGRKPWTIWTAATNLARLHAQLHSTVAPAQLPSLKASTRQEIERSHSVPLEFKDLASAAPDRLPEGDAVCHWDFHPGNVIETANGPKVIDWTSARRGDALADVARTLLIIRGGALPPGTPFLVRNLTALGRAVLGWQYLREYRRLRPFDDAKIASWTVVSVASRLSYGLSQEREQLLERLRLETSRELKSIDQPS
jgi:aminoglycoside phosphotransferase (APT) family kinase protein